LSDELKKCITVLFRQKGKDLMNEREFVYAASMDLHWFSPKDAQKLLDISIKNDLLRLSQGLLAPTFKITDKNLEMDYRPAEDILQNSKKDDKIDPFMHIVEKIAKTSKLSKKEIVARTNKIRERIPVYIEVAALITARNLGIDIGKEIEMVRNEILNATESK